MGYRSMKRQPNREDVSFSSPQLLAISQEIVIEGGFDTGCRLKKIQLTNSGLFFLHSIRSDNLKSEMSF